MNCQTTLTTTATETNKTFEIQTRKEVPDKKNMSYCRAGIKLYLKSGCYQCATESPFQTDLSQHYEKTC